MAIGRNAVTAAAEHMKGPYTFVELDAGHWLVQEQPERVTSDVIAHLRAHPA
jgi:hypothetical protein